MYAQLKAWTNCFITCPHQLSRERNLAFYNLKNIAPPERSLTCSHVTHYKIHITVSPQCFLFTKNQNERPRKKINKHNAKETWLESYADWQDLMVSCKWYWTDFLTWYLTGLLGKERCYRLVCCLSRLKVPCKLNSSPPRLFHDYFNLWLRSDCGNTTRLILLILRSSLVSMALR